MTTLQVWVVDYLRAQAGKHFDPALVEKFIGLLPEVLTVRDQYLELPVSS